MGRKRKQRAPPAASEDPGADVDEAGAGGGGGEGQVRLWELREKVRAGGLDWVDGSVDERFAGVLVESYPRFRVLSKDCFPEGQEGRAGAALEALRSAPGVFRTDHVWVRGGLTQTRVLRVLLGDPGVTYRYKDLRLFAVPWSSPPGEPEGWEEDALNGACAEIRVLNGSLQASALASLGEGPPADGAYTFNVALINLLDETDSRADMTTVEPYYGMGRMAVSWHADDGVLPGSSIAVYNFMPPFDGDPFLHPLTYRPAEPATPAGIGAGGGTETLMDFAASASGGHAETMLDIDSADLATPLHLADTPVVLSAASGGHGETMMDLAASVGHIETVLDKGAASSIKTKSFRDTPLAETPVDFAASGGHGEAGPISERRDETGQLLLDKQSIAVHLAGGGHDETVLVARTTGQVDKGADIDSACMTPETTHFAAAATDAPNAAGDDIDGVGGESAAWKVGLKVAWDIKTPAVAVPMVSGEGYVMLAGFNEAHQHCVISGDARRFSSTHRVADPERSTLGYIEERCLEALKLSREPHPDALRVFMEVHTELEAEWLRQFYFQGLVHASVNVWWTGKMRELQKHFRAFERRTAGVVALEIRRSIANEIRRSLHLQAEQT
ncbi:FTO catalytic domain-containing protein, partial [Baffinella frigidus]